MKGFRHRPVVAARLLVIFLAVALSVNMGACSKVNISKYDDEDIALVLKANDPELEKKVDEIVESIPEKIPFMGTILIAKDGKVLVNKGYGKSHIGMSELNIPQTVFQISTITMQFSAVAIMQLEEKGKLKIEDKLSKYLPDFPFADKITIRQLLSHTSGIPNEDPRVTISAKNRRDKSIEALVRLNRPSELLFEPGEGFNYTFTNYYLLGYIIEMVSGMEYKEYMRTNIFEPLNMLSTDVFMVESDTHTIARGHLQEGYADYFVAQAYYNLHAVNSIFSTTEDLYRWDRALYTERILSKESIEKMHKASIIKGEGKENEKVHIYGMMDIENYGYGLGLNYINGHKAVVMEGIEAGFQTLLLRFIEDDAVIIILGNNFEAPMVTESNVSKLVDILFLK